MHPELKEAKIKLAKFAKLDPFKNIGMYYRGAEAVLVTFCLTNFEITKSPEYQKPNEVRIDLSECGKKVTITMRGQKLYQGTITYLGKWWKARKELKTLEHSLKTSSE
jgi:hypothetical protein